MVLLESWVAPLLESNEGVMACKRLGELVMARTFERQVIELQVALLNRFSQLGCTQTVAVAWLRRHVKWVRTGTDFEPKCATPFKCGLANGAISKENATKCESWEGAHLCRLYRKPTGLSDSRKGRR